MKFSAEIGCLNRGYFKNFIKRFCFVNDIEIEIFDEDRGFLSSSFQIKLRGEEYKLLALENRLKE